MLTDEDIQKLLIALETKFPAKQDLKDSLDDNVQKSLKVFPTKDEVATKQDIKNALYDIKHEIIELIEYYSERADKFYQEFVLIRDKFGK